MAIVIRAQFILILTIIVLFHALGYTDSYIGLAPFINNTSDTTVLNLHEKLFKRLQFEQLPGTIKPYIIENEQCETCVAYVNGSIEFIDSKLSLKLVVSASERENREQKTLPLSGYSIDDVIDLCVLKIRNFLEQNYSTKLRVSSTPLDCEMYLNGIKVGMTPAELILERGIYRLTLEHEYCKAYRDTFAVTSGQDIDIDATLQFTGYRYKPFLLSSAFFTVSTTVIWILEGQFHNRYKKLKRDTPNEVFNAEYNKYRTANYIRIGLLNGAILSWSATGYFSFKNKMLKKKLFTKLQNH